MAPISLRSVSDDFELGPVQRAILADSKYALVNVDKASLAPYYTRVTYTLNGVGAITHFVANKAATARPGGPNDLFRQLQVVDVGLRRYPLQQSVGKSAYQCIGSLFTDTDVESSCGYPDFPLRGELCMLHPAKTSPSFADTEDDLGHAV